MTETPEFELTTSSSSDEEIPGDVAGPVTLETAATTDVVIPVYPPLDLPYSQWAAHRSQELLDANGYGDTAEEWRRAAEHVSGAIRGAAYHLLIQEPDPMDEALFRQALGEIDETVRAYAAYGLVGLGDQSAVSTLEAVAGLNVNAHRSAPRAAGLLGLLGDATAYATILSGMEAKMRIIRLVSIQNAFPFVTMHGQTYAPDLTIDIWALYRQALQDSDEHVRAVARMQLEELNTAEALQLLEEYPEP